jgi:RHS repeat-associated protein
MGNTLFLTDDSGSITDSYGYTPYGVWVDSSGTFDNPFTFGGALGVMREGGTGLYYMRARYYDSRTARFISVDPLWPDFLEIKSLNPYEYGAQNPLRYSDPTGNKEYDLVFIESEKGRLDEELSHFSLHYQEQNPQWSDTVAGIKRYIDKLLKDDTCDCVKSLNLVGHGSNLGEGPFNLALENLRSMEKHIRRRVIPKAVRKGILSGERTTLWNRLSKRRAERAVAKQYYKKRGGKLGELVVLLMDIKWCPQNQGVTFTSCNLLGNWGWSDDKTVAKLQLLANRTGLKLTGYTTKARVSRGRFVLGVTKTVTPDVTR